MIIILRFYNIPYIRFLNIFIIKILYSKNALRSSVSVVVGAIVIVGIIVVGINVVVGASVVVVAKVVVSLDSSSDFFSNY